MNRTTAAVTLRIMSIACLIGALICFTLALTGCDDPSPPHWDNVCVQRKPVTSVGMGIPIGSGSPQMVITTTSICVEYERRCIVGKDYQGDNRECQP